MEEWAYNYGIQRDEGLQLSYSSEDAGHAGDAAWDMSVMTAAPLAAGTCVLSVPESLILSSNKVMAELRTHDMDPAEKVLSSINADTELGQYYLMVKILVECEKGAASPWYPWLNA